MVLLCLAPFLSTDSPGYKNVYEQSGSAANVVVRQLSTIVVGDVNPPLVPALRHCANATAAGCAVSATASCTSACLYFGWDPVSDADSGVRFLRLVVNQTASGTGITTQVADVALGATTVSYSTCSTPLAPGAIVSARLIATDMAGNWAARPGATVLLVDGTAPVAPTVAITAGANLGVHTLYTSTAGDAVAAVGTFVDADSGLALLHVRLRSAGAGPGADRGSITLTPAQLAASGGLVRLSSLALACGGQYEWVVDAVNGAGCTTTATSPVVVVDTTDPDVSGAVVQPVSPASPSGASITCSPTSTSITIRFSGVVDACSSVARYDLALAHASNRSLATGWSPFTGILNQSAAFPHVGLLALPPGFPDGAYTAVVRATDQVGKSALAYSAPVTLDTSGPLFQGPATDALLLGSHGSDVDYSNQDGAACVAFAVADPGSGVVR